MKITSKLILFAIVAATIYFIDGMLVTPVSVVAKNTAAVATVNGGNAALINQNALETVTGFPWTVLTLGVLFFVLFTKDIVKAVKSL